MARIAGIDLPRDKRIEIALTYIFGIGRKTASDICAATGVDPDIRVRDLSEAQWRKVWTFPLQTKSRGIQYPPVP